jgi:polysaccharide pyruvyl transferase WcaK-like protein
MSLLRQLGDRLSDRLRPAADAVAAATDPDRVLQGVMSGFIERARVTWPDLRHGRWRPGEPLRLLFAGYAGTRNTGGDVRVEEMIRQFRHVLGPDNVDLSLLTFDAKLTRGYFRTVKQIEMPLVFPKFLYDTLADQHGLVACEGSMFKSKFASALTTFMVGGLGLANAGDKLSIAYGGEAGAMTPTLEDMVRKHCAESLILCRNEASRGVLGGLGLKTHSGTDTAWAFDPAPHAAGQALLRAHGWDGVRPVLVLCPINPYWWPVRPDLARAAALAALGLHRDDHYRSIYFHHHGDDVDRRFDAYLESWARAVRAFRRHDDPFIVCVAMEQLDRRACEDLAARLGGAAVLGSDQVQMYELVSVLRQARYLLSSRYHAIVTSMPAGIPSAGVTMDERIRNLMADRGQPELCLEVDDPDLSRRIEGVLDRLAGDPANVRDGIEGCVVDNLERMGAMGRVLARHVRDRLAGFPLPDGMGDAGPWHHLPPFPPAVAELVAARRPRGEA